MRKNKNMKKINIVKASLFTLILAFMVSGMFAIAAVMNKEKPVEVTEKAVVMETWEFTGTDPLDATHYTLVGSTSPDCSLPEQEICTIQAPEDEDNSGYPDLNAEIELPNNEVKTVEELIDEALESLKPGASPKPNKVVQAFRATN